MFTTGFEKSEAFFLIKRNTIITIYGRFYDSTHSPPNSLVLTYLPGEQRFAEWRGVPDRTHLHAGAPRAPSALES